MGMLYANSKIEKLMKIALHLLYIFITSTIQSDKQFTQNRKEN